MHPVLFRIPGLDFPIRSFGVLVAAGIFLGIWLWGKLLERHGDDPENDPMRGSQVALWIVVGIFAGARFMYVIVESARYLAAEITEPVQRYLAAGAERSLAAASLSAADLESARQVAVGYDFLHDPLLVFAIWKGGLVMYGGLAGGAVVGLWAAWKHGLRIWNTVDTGLIAGFLGLAIGRWGCLLVGDDYGSVVPAQHADLPFPITVRVPELEWLLAHPESLFDHDLAGKTIWATQIWMSINSLLIVAVGLFLLKRRRWVGQVGAWMVVQYAVTRFVIEIFRGDEIRGLWFGDTVSTSQLVSVAGLLFGVFLLWKKPGPPVSSEAA